MQPPLPSPSVARRSDNWQQPEEFTAEFNAFMDAYLTELEHEALALSPDYGRLWSNILKTYRAGGKRLRPYLVYAAYRTLAGPTPEPASFWPIAGAVECLHMAMLMHDDIIDRDEIRHGRPNMSGAYRTIYGQAGAGHDTGHFADSAALLAGDALISEAYRMITGSDIDFEKKQYIQMAFAKAMFEVVGGELLDTEAAFIGGRQTDSRLIARLKTAGYSCVMPLTVGGILAGADEETLDILSSIGTAIGTAYQLQDDDLGVYGNETATGKSASNDLREGKRTTLVQTALAMATPDDAAQLETYITGPDLREQDILACRQIIELSGARQAVSEECREYTRQALAAVGRLPISEPDKIEVRNLLRSLVERTS